MIKDKKKQKEKNRKLEHNQTRMNRVLEALGVTALHKKLYLPIREYLVQHPDPPMILQCDEKKTLPDGIRRPIGWWNEAAHKGITSSDFIEVMRPLLRFIRSARGQEVLAVPDEGGSFRADKEFVDQYLKPAKEYQDFFYAEFQNLFVFLSWLGTSVDSQYISTSLSWDTLSQGRVRTCVKVKTTPAQSSYFAKRKNHRIGLQQKMVSGVEQSPVLWLSQSPRALGLYGKETEKLPVYVSEHALERMHERLDTFVTQVLTTSFLYGSMRNPVVHPQRDPTASEDSLVECRVTNSGPKLGYFVVSRTEKEIFIKTFLSLTMHKTPEGHLLHRRLRMARPDYCFHALDRCSTFLNTDIATHPTLVPIWEECGFTEFLSWIRSRNMPTVVQEAGDDMVKYFQL